MVARVPDALTALMSSFHAWVGARCLSLARPTMGQFEACVSSDYLCLVSTFLCFMVLVLLEGFNMMMHDIR